MSHYDKFLDEYYDAKAAANKQVGGNHYKEVAIQPIDFITKNNIPWHEANVIKYTFRHRNKNGIEDLRKAKHYLEMLCEDLYGETL